jgi:hypothetical protein
MDMSDEDSDTSGIESDETSNDSYNFDKDSDMDDFGSDDRGSSSYNFDKLEELLLARHNKPAEWLRLKEQSKNPRQEMANGTRQRNRSLLKPPQASESAKELQETPRRRPCKPGVAKKEAPKHGRGRPLKMANKMIKAGLKQSRPLL